MKYYISILLLVTLSSCQFILPSYIDGEPFSEEINESYLIEEYLHDSFCLIKKDRQNDNAGVVIIENIDSICFIDKNEIYLHSNEKYYLITEEKVTEIDTFNYKMTSIETYFNISY
jgi:hypothetical protein